MATISIYVPINGNDRRSQGWTVDVSEHIDAGNGVEFVDEADRTTAINVSHIQLNTEGSISFYGRGYSSTAAISVTLSAGGFHNVGGIHGIRAAGTSTNAGIHVKV